MEKEKSSTKGDLCHKGFSPFLAFEEDLFLKERVFSTGKKRVFFSRSEEVDQKRSSLGAPIAQWIGRRTSDAKIEGSSPSRRRIFFQLFRS